jgi:hypothetical protein
MKITYPYKILVQPYRYDGMKTYVGFVVIAGVKIPSKIERTTIDDAIRDAQRMVVEFDERPASDCLSPTERALEAAQIHLSS